MTEYEYDLKIEAANIYEAEQMALEDEMLEDYCKIEKDRLKELELIDKALEEIG